MCRRDGLTRRMIQRSPGGQFPALLIRPVISATSLSSSACPSWVTPGFHAAAGTCRMSSSSAPVMVQPLVNSSFPPGISRVIMCVMKSWLVPAPSSRTMTFRRKAAGTCRSAADSPLT